MNGSEIVKGLVWGPVGIEEVLGRGRWNKIDFVFTIATLPMLLKSWQ